ncbi:DUF4153 domain-containing protein [Streptomyces sp. NPDC048604]|uniref:DUF4153 domain-containing protein n=1 Tax=Streptomyces sp. NPDC048604 TaxID=3365578 RepID=UPI00372140C4
MSDTESIPPSPEEPRAAEPSPADASAAASTPAVPKPAEPEPAAPKSAEPKPTEPTPAVPAAAQPKPAVPAPASQQPSGPRRPQQQGPYAHPAYQPWVPPGQGPVHDPLDKLRPPAPARATSPTLWAILATALLTALLMDGGLGVNLLLIAVPAVLAAGFAARAAGRRLRPWTLVWALGGLALLAVPALIDAGWPTFLAVVTAVALTAFALHGGRGWPSILFSPFGLAHSLGAGTVWTWRSMRARAEDSRSRVGPVLRPVLVALVLLIVFGALFAGADAAFADLLGSLLPDISLVQAPWRFSLFLLGLFGAMAVARTGAAPLRWDRMEFSPGRARARMEWALPLVVLCLLFAAFNAVQLAVLFGGYDKVLKETGLTYSAYARQGFWQLLIATLLTLVVIGLALRWAPRSDARDRTLVRAVLGALCVLTLVVVASALRRMDLYVDAYGLTRLRISVAAMEIWLGVVLLLIMAAGVFGARLLPRAVAASAAVGVLGFGLISPDAIIAQNNVDRYERLGKIDVDYVGGLSADAVPALDRLPEPKRSCALVDINNRLIADESWYATSWSRERARDILEDRKVHWTPGACGPKFRDVVDDDYDPDSDGDPYAPTDPYGTP